MKIIDVSSGYTPKMSPHCDNLDILIKKAQLLIEDGAVDVGCIPISKILFTQSNNEHDKEDLFNEYKDLPFAVLMDGYFHLLDGHSRIVDAISEGETEIILLIADSDASDDVLQERKKKGSKSPVIPYSGRWWYVPFNGTYDDHDSTDNYEPLDIETGSD